MTRLSAAVLATAAVAVAAAGVALSAGPDTAVRAEVLVAREGHPLDVRSIRIVDGLRPGASYRLPAVTIRNHRGLPTTFRLVVLRGAARGWMRFVPTEVVIDAGRSRAVALRLELPDDAEPGPYAVVLGARPGGAAGARLIFRVEPASAGSRGRRATSLVVWLVPALVGATLVVAAAARARGRSRVPASRTSGQSARTTPR